MDWLPKEASLLLLGSSFAFATPFDPAEQNPASTPAELLALLLLADPSVLVLQKLLLLL